MPEKKKEEKKIEPDKKKKDVNKYIVYINWL
jgi:hypothetical protein